MASLVRGSRNNLRIQFYWQGKLERVSLGVPDTRRNRAEYASLLKDVAAAIRLGQDPMPLLPREKAAAPVGLTVGECARRWLASKLKLRPQTRRQYEGLFVTFLDETALGSMPVTELTRHHITEALKGKAVRRAQMFRQRLHTVCAQLVADGLLLRNPVEYVEAPTRETPREPIEPLSWTEKLALLNAATGQDRLYIALGLATGLRPGELLTIERRDVDLRTARLYVRGTKTAGAARVIELLPDALEAMRELLTHGAQIGPLFHGGRGRRWILANWRRRNWDAIIAQAGIPHRSPNVMRHTYAVDRLIEGRDVVWVSKQLGHQNSATIHRFYARWTNTPKTEVGGK